MRILEFAPLEFYPAMPILSQEAALYPATLLTELAVFPSSQDHSSPQEEFADTAQMRLWWAIYTRSRQEKALARKLYAYRIPFYLPLVPQQHLYRGRKVTSYIPLFSGYLFMFGNDDERIAALTTNCISRMLPVEDAHQLRRNLLHIHQLIETEAPITIEQRLQPGRKVRIKSGAMKGVEGVVVQRRGQNRLLVMVNYIQQGVSVAIDDFMVEPL